MLSVPRIVSLLVLSLFLFIYDQINKQMSSPAILIANIHIRESWKMCVKYFTFLESSCFTNFKNLVLSGHFLT